MLTKIQPHLIILLMTAVSAPAQTSGTDVHRANRFAIPTLGFVASAGGLEVQPIVGIPGALRLGEPIAMPEAVTGLHIAAGQSYVLAEQGGTDPLSVALLEAGMNSEDVLLTPIAGATTKADLAVFSPNASSAAVFSAQTNQIQVIGGLPKSPQVIRSVYAATPKGMAISDDGAVLLTEDGSHVYLSAGGTALHAVYSSGKIAAIAFASKSENAIVCDGGQDLVALLQPNGDIATIASNANGVQSPELAESTADGRLVLIASVSRKTLWTIDPVSKVITKSAVNGAFRSFDRLSLRDSFLLTPAPGGNYSVLVWQGNALQTFSVGTRSVGGIQ